MVLHTLTHSHSHRHKLTLDECSDLTAFLRRHFLHDVQCCAVLIVHNAHVNTWDRWDSHQDQTSIHQLKGSNILTAKVRICRKKKSSVKVLCRRVVKCEEKWEGSGNQKHNAVSNDGGIIIIKRLSDLRTCMHFASELHILMIKMADSMAKPSVCWTLRYWPTLNKSPAPSFPYITLAMFCTTQWPRFLWR